MRRYFFPLIVTGLLLAFSLGSAYAAAPAAAKQCEACHGTNGVTTDKHIPVLAGMSAFYLDGEIQAYKKGLRPCPKTKFPNDSKKPATDMCDIAKKLSAADVTAVDKFFESQKFVAPDQQFDAAAAAKGKVIHNTECELCHTDGGSEAMDDAGILAGQWIPYLQETFKEYQSGKRTAPEKMKPKIMALKPDQVNALIQFYASEGKK